MDLSFSGHLDEQFPFSSRCFPVWVIIFPPLLVGFVTLASFSTQMKLQFGVVPQSLKSCWRGAYAAMMAPSLRLFVLAQVMLGSKMARIPAVVFLLAPISDRLQVAQGNISD